MLTGRKEHDDAIKGKVITGLEGYPQIIMDYFERSGGSQATSKKVFVNRIKKFVTFLQEEKGFDIYDEGCWKDLTEDEISDWILSCKYKKNGSENSAKTLNDYLIIVDNFCKFLVKRRLITYNPCPSKADLKGIIPSEIRESKVVSMTKDETQLVTESIEKTSPHPARDICIFKLGCRTGLRAQALSEIDISDIDFEAREMVVIEKGNFLRHIKLGSSTLQLIEDCIRERRECFGNPDTDALFVRRFHGTVARISSRHIAELIRNNTDMLDKHITPHKMRSTCITVTYEHTGDIFDAARKAGHHNIRNTMLYINTEKKDEKLAEDMDELI